MDSLALAWGEVRLPSLFWTVKISEIGKKEGEFLRAII
jgi:hypothetical protein